MASAKRRHRTAFVLDSPPRQGRQRTLFRPCRGGFSIYAYFRWLRASALATGYRLASLRDAAKTKAQRVDDRLLIDSLVA